jgi:hypothetical protein
MIDPIEERITEATENLDTAIFNVAEAAKMISIAAEFQPRTDNYVVDAELMGDLRAALKDWTNATEKFLAACQEAELNNG